MHRNYLNSALRAFNKNRTYGSINILGLVLGLTSCLLITLHVMEEFSYDNFHPDHPNLYRLIMEFNVPGQTPIKSAPVYPSVGPVFTKSFPEVENFTRILPFGEGVYSVKKPDGTLIRFNEEKAVFADDNFFQTFGFKLVKGDPMNILTEQHQTVLSASTAKRYFGSEDPIGKSISFRGRRDYIVVGVMEDFPENSHLQFDIVNSLRSWDGFDEWEQNWGWYDFYTYLSFREGTQLNAFIEKATELFMLRKLEANPRESSVFRLEAQAVANIHLHSKGVSWDMGDNGGAQGVYFLGIIAAMVLFIAWVNFVNLSTARAVNRAREVGIRKVVGALRWHLLQQFLVEAFFFNLVALVISLCLVVGFVPLINATLDLSLDPMLLLAPEVLMGTLVLLVAGSIISGLYPAVVLSSFKPLMVLKGQFYSRRKRFGFRQVLVGFQFTISIVLILGTMVVVKQLSFMQSRDLGLNIDQTLVLKAPSSSPERGDLIQRKDVFVNRLDQVRTVKGFTVSNTIPGEENFSISSFYTREHPEDERDCYRVRTDENFFPDFGIEIIAGRNFIKDMASDSNAVLLNRTAVKTFGFDTPEEAVGEILNPNNRYTWRVVGVVEDYHHNSLKRSLDPIMFSYRPNSDDFFSLKVADQDIVATITEIENIWNEVYPDNPFDFFFLDEFFDRQYKSDRRFNTVFSAFAIFAIVVASLGLFGLISFTVEQSRKEIGIRKVLGATVHRVVLLLLRDYAFLVAISFVIGFPAGYYLMNAWLQDFAYQTTMGPLLFVSGALIVVAITLLTVSFKSFAAAQQNPVDALRNE